MTSRTVASSRQRSSGGHGETEIGSMASEEAIASWLGDDLAAMVQNHEADLR